MSLGLLHAGEWPKPPDSHPSRSTFQPSLSLAPATHSAGWAAQRGHGASPCPGFHSPRSRCVLGPLILHLRNGSDEPSQLPAGPLTHRPLFRELIIVMGRGSKIPSQEHLTSSKGRNSKARNPGSQPIGSPFEPGSGLT